MSSETDAVSAIAQDLLRYADWHREEGGPLLESVQPAPPHAVQGEVLPPPGVSLKPVSRALPLNIELPTPAVALEPARPLEAIRAEIGDCRRCKLCEGRQNIVFGVGNPRADLVFVGEGPGADEDVQGEPFVGRAGQLLTKMIGAMGFERSAVYICNVVKCRPPGNRNPEPDEIAACEPFLKAQLASVQPKIVVALGKFAAQTLLRDTTPITRLRGRWREYGGIQLMPTYHPAYLLRNPAEKKSAWTDLKEVMKALGKGSGSGGDGA